LDQRKPQKIVQLLYIGLATGTPPNGNKVEGFIHLHKPSSKNCVEVLIEACVGTYIGREK
jgi:hypothetical protein